MGWFNGFVLFVIIWWTALFAVLPLGTRPVEDPDSLTGWRGAPEHPRLGRRDSSHLQREVRLDAGADFGHAATGQD